MNEDIVSVISSYMDDFTLLIFSLLSKQTYRDTRLDISEDKQICLEVDLKSFGHRKLDLVQLIRNEQLSGKEIELIMKFYGGVIEQYYLHIEKPLMYILRSKDAIKYLITKIDFEEERVKIKQLESYNFTKKMCKNEKDVKYLCSTVPDKYLSKKAISEILQRKVSKRRVYNILF